MAVSGSISGMPDEYSSFASGFSWMNLQFKPSAVGLPRIGDAPVSRSDAALAAVGDGSDGDTASSVSVEADRRLMHRMLSSNSSLDALAGSLEEGGMENMLLAMGMSSDELFLGNLLAILVGGMFVSGVHIGFNFWLKRRTNAKRRKAFRKALVNGEKVEEPLMYSVPRMMEFPRAEMAFSIVVMMGFCQSSLTVLTLKNSLGWTKAIAATSLVLVLGSLSYAVYILFQVWRMVNFTTYCTGRVSFFGRPLSMLGKALPCIWKKLPKCCTRSIANCTMSIRNKCRPKKDRKVIPENSIIRHTPDGQDGQDGISQGCVSVVETVDVGKKVSPRLILGPAVTDLTKKQKKALDEEKGEESEANLRKAAQYAGKWQQPDAEPPGTYTADEEARRMKIFDKWKWLFDKHTPHGIAYIPAFMLFKLLVCAALLCLKDKSQMWCLVLVYAVWLWFVISGQPHIAHKKKLLRILWGVCQFMCGFGTAAGSAWLDTQADPRLTDDVNQHGDRPTAKPC
jgi:hypothetical protein